MKKPQFFKPGLMIKYKADYGLDLLVSLKLTIQGKVLHNEDIPLTSIMKLHKLQQVNRSHDNPSRLEAHYYEIYKANDVFLYSTLRDYAISFNLELVFGTLGGKWYDQPNGLITSLPYKEQLKEQLNEQLYTVLHLKE